MNEYTFDQCEIGLEASFKVHISDSFVERFKDTTGDINPMHIDASYAMSKGYDNVIVYGMGVASFYSTLVGVYLPGRFALLAGIDIQFPKPVYIGDEIVISGKIVSRDEIYRRITIKAEIRNQKGEKVSRARILVGVLDTSDSTKTINF